MSVLILSFVKLERIVTARIVTALVCGGSEGCKFFSLVELWRNAAPKNSDVELRADVELRGTLQGAGRDRACDAAGTGRASLDFQPRAIWYKRIEFRTCVRSHLASLPCRAAFLTRGSSELQMIHTPNKQP